MNVSILNVCFINFANSEKPELKRIIFYTYYFCFYVINWCLRLMQLTPSRDPTYPSTHWQVPPEHSELKSKLVHCSATSQVSPTWCASKRKINFSNFVYNPLEKLTLDASGVGGVGDESSAALALVALQGQHALGMHVKSVALVVDVALLIKTIHI